MYPYNIIIILRNISNSNLFSDYLILFILLIKNIYYIPFFIIILFFLISKIDNVRWLL